MNRSDDSTIPPLVCSAADIIARVLMHDRRVLLFGPPGVGKSTLVGDIASALADAGRNCWCLSADPGSPAFCIPGAVALARREQGAWRVVAFEALCTLDAGRFRLPLVSAVRRLAQRQLDGVVFIDGPGVVRGVAGRELLGGLVEAGNVEVILALSAAGRPPPLLDELRALPVEVQVVVAAPQANRPGKRARARGRTVQWDAYLAHSREHHLDVARIDVLGTPPPLEAENAWLGRQVALLGGQQTLVMGEITALHEGRLTLRAPLASVVAEAVLVRDAQRNTDGLLETAQAFAAERLGYLPPPDIVPYAGKTGGPRIVGRVGSLDVALVNGVFGDPLLHARLRHQARSLLFDLGEGGRLPARLAHQVTDVFISHAHLDHIGGFLWLLRSRVDGYPACRLYGPPGLARHIEGFIQGVLWDRVGDRGPVFEIGELHGEHLQRYRLQAGHSGFEGVDEIAITDGVILEETRFRVRAVTLDHHTPVLAFAFEPDQELKVRKDRLQARGWAPGPWLGDLKRHLLAGEGEAQIALPDGSVATVSVLGAELVLISPGKRLVYATDLADTPDNRLRLAGLARGAHTLFCEAMFLEEDRDNAARHGHLTARACGEIATEAGVARLVPFHFSRRYEDDPQPLYDELGAACSRVVLPQSMAASPPLVTCW